MASNKCQAVLLQSCSMASLSEGFSGYMLSTAKMGLTWPPPQGLSLVQDLHQLWQEGEASSGLFPLRKCPDSSCGQQH